MTSFFGVLCREGSRQEGGCSLSVHGSATLASPQAEAEKATVAVHNNMASVINTLAEGFSIQKLRLIGRTDSSSDEELDFSIDSSLVISALKLHKAEKGIENDKIYIKKRILVYYFLIF